MQLPGGRHSAYRHPQRRRTRSQSDVVRSAGRGRHHDVPAGLQPRVHRELELHGAARRRRRLQRAGRLCREPRHPPDRDSEINAAGPGGGNAGRALFPAFGRISDIKYFVPFNTAKYNGLQTQVTRRFGGSLLGLSYTLSRSIGYVDDTDGGLTWNWIPMLQRNKAVAGFDRTHNLQFYGNYDLPFGRGQKYAKDGCGFEDCGRMADELDPEPDERNAVHGRHVRHFRERARQYADGGPDCCRTWRSWADTDSASPTSIRTPSAPVTAVRFGNSGRNILRGPGVFNLDASVFRKFRMTERFALEVRAEMFGVTNTPQFGNPGATASSLTRNADGTIKALNGFTEITSATGERQARFAAKITF